MLCRRYYIETRPSKTGKIMRNTLLIISQKVFLQKWSLMEKCLLSGQFSWTLGKVSWVHFYILTQVSSTNKGVIPTMWKVPFLWKKIDKTHAADKGRIMDIQPKSRSGFGTLPRYTFVASLMKIYYIQQQKLAKQVLSKGDVTSRLSPTSILMVTSTYIAHFSYITVYVHHGDLVFLDDLEVYLASSHGSSWKHT